MKRFHGFFKRCVGVVAVTLIEIDIVCTQALERSIQLLLNLSGGEAAIRFVSDGKNSFVAIR